VLAERLWKTVDWKFEYINEGIGIPDNADIVAARES
jgi:hypothetical protein